jgi:beta propeller repeat protein
LCLLSKPETLFADFNDFPISIRSDEEGEPVISGDYVVWQSYADGNWDIYGHNLATQSTFPITKQSGRQLAPAISGNYAVWYGVNESWSSQTGIAVYNFSTGEKTTISSSGSHPDVSGNLVVWGGTQTLNVYDLSLNSMVNINTQIARYPSIDNGIIVGLGNDGYIYIAIIC